MRMSVIGCGYLGAVHATAMATIGHDVVGIDVDPGKIASLEAAKAPFFEPGLDDLLDTAHATGKLRFTTDVAEAAGARVHFIAVGTPQQKDSEAADLTYVDAAVASLLPHLAEGDLVVGKSTVPVGTAQRLSALIETTGARLAWNPEFLREGFAVKDTLEPDRIVYGLKSPAEDPEAVALLDEVYHPAMATQTPRMVTDFATAELVKVAANAFLATKISFINAMAEIADAAGADVTQLADAIGQDARIGRRFLNAGVGFGGGCLPKDIRAFTARAQELGKGDAVRFLEEVDGINLRRREHLADLVQSMSGGDLTGANVTVLGLAFKPDSDDTRDSPALDIAARLSTLGANVVAHDPEAIENARRIHPHLRYVSDLEDAIRGADILVVGTEWNVYRQLEPERAAQLAARRIVVDGRNCLDATKWREAGWTYRGYGRP